MASSRLEVLCARGGQKANQVAPQTKLESARSLGQHSGGVLSEHDRVLSESNRHHGEEEMAPAPTPPPPMVLLTPRNKSKRRKERERDQLRSRSDNTLEGYESKRKKRKKKPHSPSEGTIFTTHSSGETINLMNGRPNGRVNGHISYMEADSLAKATLPPLHRNAFSSSSSSLADNDDTQDLQAAIDEAKRLRDLEEGAAPAGGGSKHTPLPPPDSSVGFSDIDCCQFPSESEDARHLEKRKKKKRLSPRRPPRPEGVEPLKLPPDSD